MRIKKVALYTLHFTLILALAATGSALYWTLGKVRAFENQHQCDVFANLSPSEVLMKNAGSMSNVACRVSSAAAVAGRPPYQATNSTAKASEPTEMKVLGVVYDGDEKLRVHLSLRPDMGVARQYVSVEPMAEGSAAVSYEMEYNRSLGKHMPVLVVTGDYAHRTNVTLRIRRGLPPHSEEGGGLGETALPNGRCGGRDVGDERREGREAMVDDFVYSFRRKDRNPYVKFAAPGRYLPPGGIRSIGLESVNVGKIKASICRVEPCNVVQLLAREEKVYSRYSWSGNADDEETAELAGEAENATIECENRLNEKGTSLLPIRLNDGKPTNGVFLVSVMSGDMPRRDYVWENSEKHKLNPLRCRLVCLSDLGLSVRKCDPDGLGVWVTSLMKGTPVGGARVEVYSSAGILVMTGTTDALGWCRPERKDKGEPFAVVVRSDDDMTFMALRDSMEVDESHPDGARAAYLAENDLSAFCWTDRGIFRHGEWIMLHALVRNGVRRAPRPTPIRLELLNPKGNVYSAVTLVTDDEGAVFCDKFKVPDEQPSGTWTLRAKLPGEKGHVIGSREIKIEEFAPPQIRVRVETGEVIAKPIVNLVGTAPRAVRGGRGATALPGFAIASCDSPNPTNFGFTVSAEHLFGGPAHGLVCEGAVVFEDVPFVPAKWKGWHFGNDGLGLQPNFRNPGKDRLDRDGRISFAAPLWASTGLPKAAVRATAQGVVFEDGGRPATARKSVVTHFYPYYIGSSLSDWMKLERGAPLRVGVACVSPDGRRLGEPRRLSAQLERVDTVYSYRERGDGCQTWDCDRVRALVASNIVLTTETNLNSVLEIPADRAGDYVLTIRDTASNVSYSRSFYLSDWGDTAVRAPLSDPTEVSIATDKPTYRAGESPRLTVKSPFAGFALLTVMRDKEVYSEVLDLTNATSEVVLRPVCAEHAPNVDVSISVVQSVGANSRHLAARAHGQATVRIRPAENEVPVALEAKLVDLREVDGTAGAGRPPYQAVDVDIEAPNATVAVVTVVDEAINILTGEPTPDPVEWFSQVRGAEHPLYDLYGRILPVLGERQTRVGGVKTGGGADEGMLGRVSPVPTRRFKPLALWTGRVPVVEGKAHAVVKLPEFVGELRVTAVAYSATASGAASVQRKVTPKLVAMPDAPRFVAPGDVFEATLPIHNRSGEVAKFGCSVSTNGALAVNVPLALLEVDGHTNIVASLKAPLEPGELEIAYHVRGMGEVHDQTIRLPVRPAVAWVETAGVERLKGGKVEKLKSETNVSRLVSNVACRVSREGRDPSRPTYERYWERVWDSPLGEYEPALRWLAEYPHGCLEQTTSRMFPLICAGGLLNSVVTNGPDVVAAGVRRVESMIRRTDFVMWPDCDYAPWDREVSLYAAHFLIEAERCGQRLAPSSRERVMNFLRKWSVSTNNAVSAYACHTLALADAPDRDRMLRLYDAATAVAGRPPYRTGGSRPIATGLSLLSRARLARAFALTHDAGRAKRLLGNAASPSSVKEASFALVALLEIDDSDERVLPLVEYLCRSRDKAKLSWGTTEGNAHALMALGEYYRHHPPKRGEKFVSWRRLALPDIRDVRDESAGLSVSRRFFRPEGEPADLGALRCGELLIVELAITADDTRTLSDLVVEDLFAGAFEPVHGALPECFAAKHGGTNEVPASAWVMRSDARDDRMLVFSKKFTLERGHEAKFRYQVRVVSAGEFVLPGPSVEGMYHPALHARRVPGRIVVRH